jgi:hypothetical protein
MRTRCICDYCGREFLTASEAIEHEERCHDNPKNQKPMKWIHTGPVPKVRMKNG